jgi:hypothetical protein
MPSPAPSPPAPPAQAGPPADGVVTVLLGLAAYGQADFGNFKVEVADRPGPDGVLNDVVK